MVGLGDFEGLTLDRLFSFPMTPNLFDLWIVEISYFRFGCVVLPGPWGLINMIMASFLLAHSKILNEWYFQAGVFFGVQFSLQYVNGLGFTSLSIGLSELDYCKGYICLQRSKLGTCYTFICILYRILSRVYFHNLLFFLYYIFERVVYGFF